LLQVPKELFAASRGGRDAERERPELPVDAGTAVAEAPAALLRRVRVPVVLHVRDVRVALLQPALQGHARGDQVHEVDHVSVRVASRFAENK